ncbi:hypothetical protein A9Q73_09145 [Bermanella sp. 47_1433_sub80_T6]|nr:hypothetical protein A9Q73_09145 [Bermanella sp. 47_1433_sub80_T6]
MYWTLIFTGIAIILSLSAIAGYYLLKLRKVKLQQNEQIELNRQAWLDSQEELAADIRFIAKAMVQQQCEITEGCLRLKVLMDRLDETLQHNGDYQTIQLHYQKTAHMPHHKAYTTLNKKQQFKLDQDRFELENQHRQKVLLEAKQLSDYQFKAPN